MTRPLLFLALIAAALSLQACVGTIASTAVGATGAVVHTTGKVAGAATGL